MTRTNLEVSGYAHPDELTWILHFNWRTSPLPMNGSRGTHWAPRAKMAKHVRHTAYYLAKAARIPLLGKCRVQLTWWVATTNRTRDVDNLAAFEKPLYDGLVDARVAADDSPAFMEKPRPVIRPVSESDGIVTGPCFTLTITRTDVEDEWGDE